VATTPQSPRTPTRPADLNAPFFNIREVAWILDCSVDTVRRSIAAGLLPCSQRMKGSAIRVSRADLDAYHEATRIVALPTQRIRRRARVAA
jgi:excisionase family DNA binding protein